MQLKIHELKKVYGSKKALDGINLSIGNGMFGLLGPNGAGKTTLMRIISTLVFPTSGGVSIGHYEVTKDQGVIRKLLGYLPQSFNPYPKLTVKEFLRYMAYLSGCDPTYARIRDCLEKVNLIDYENVRTSNLSGGLKRRLGIAQAIINEPALLIVDEPTAGLDPVERVRFRNFLSTLSSSRTVILSTHIVEDIASTCSELAVLDQGKLIFTGAPTSLASLVLGKIWEINVDSEKKAYLDKSGAIVINAVYNESFWKLKVISEVKPFETATLVPPSIEDGYMWLMNQEKR